MGSWYFTCWQFSGSPSLRVHLSFLAVLVLKRIAHRSLHLKQVVNKVERIVEFLEEQAATETEEESWGSQYLKVDRVKHQELRILGNAEEKKEKKDREKKWKKTSEQQTTDGRKPSLVDKNSTEDKDDMVVTT
jgi:hypothetical protein